MNFREKFYNLLEGMFVGDTEIEGQGGYINLLKIKKKYYDNEFKPTLQEKIEEVLKVYPNFETELFEKLYTFFSRYFSESGSIYFVNTPSYHQIYEKIYTDKEDVILFWKTKDLYYIKTDRLFKNLAIKIEDNNKEYNFFFDVSKLEYKKANEKREIIYELAEEKTNEEKIYFYVYYSEKGRKTKIDEILKALKKKDIKINEDILEKAFKRFEQQSEVDYFIHKNAKAFLTEQLKLYIYNYLFKERQEWTQERINQIYKFQEVAELIIDFVSKFEDELCKIWNKPRFVFNSNYVITLDRIIKANKEKGIEIIEKIINHKNFEEQAKEWQDLGITDENFNKDKIIQKFTTGKELNKEYQFLPIDTKYFKDLEIEILSLFDDLDNQLDGWLIKSENYQALNTILPKFKERVQTIYIDPPFKTGRDFYYEDKFRDSTWITLMENRLDKAKDFLKNSGNIFVHLDKNAVYLGRMLMNFIFVDNFVNEIIWCYEKPRKATNQFKENHDNILYYCKNKSSHYFKLLKTISLFSERKEKDLGDWWYIPSFSTKMTAIERMYFETQKPEELLKNIIECSSNEKEIILDFFAGSGTTMAVAHKMGRRWIGVELGEVWKEFYLDYIRIELKNNENHENNEEFIDDENILDKWVEKGNIYKVEKILKKNKREIEALVWKWGILGRMKMVVAGKGRREPTVLSRELNWQGGGFFKYFELEQYEEILRKAKYLKPKENTLFDKDFNYLFSTDPKMLEAIEIDYENNKVKVDLKKIYPEKEIDIAETLSNLKGKWIKKITKDEVIFEDGEKIEFKNLDYREIKKLIWW